MCNKDILHRINKPGVLGQFVLKFYFGTSTKLLYRSRGVLIFECPHYLAGSTVQLLVNVVICGYCKPEIPSVFYYMTHSYAYRTEAYFKFILCKHVMIKVFVQSNQSIHWKTLHHFHLSCEHLIGIIYVIILYIRSKLLFS